MKPVNMLTNQIEGTIKLNIQTGTEFKIIYKELTYNKKDRISIIRVKIKQFIHKHYYPSLNKEC
jgi:hypothetical protein